MAFDGGWQTVVGGFLIFMERENFTLETEEAQEIVSRDHRGYEVVSEETTGNSRWSIHRKIIVKRISDGLFFESNYSEGATEMQDEAPYEYGDADFNQVFPVEKTVIVYE